jgi:membrane protein CcdC involved in cytochrome C biogenesis
MHPALIAGSLAGAAAMVAWRVREGRTPVSLPKIIMPPLGMATGFCMFIYPPTRVPLSWAAAALALGAVAFALPLVRTSKLARQGDTIMVQRSRAFLWILLGLVAVRFALRSWIEQYIGTMQTGALFYLLAFGAVARWRIAMLIEYRQLTRRGPDPVADPGQPRAALAAPAVTPSAPPRPAAGAPLDPAPRAAR